MCVRPSAAGSLLSASVPLLVLPRWATEAAAELAQLPIAAAVAGFDAAAFLQQIGFVLHSVEWLQQQGGGEGQLEAAAACRLRRLARQLATCCTSNNWNATARLLLPALGVSAALSATAGSKAAAASKDHDGKSGDEGTDAGGAVAPNSAEEQREVELLLGQMGVDDDDDEEEAGQQPGQDEQQGQPVLPRVAAQLSDWFWAGCNLAAGMAGVAFLLRSCNAPV